MQKVLLAVAVTLGLAALAHATCDTRTQTCFTSIDVSGAASVGSMTNSGNSTVGGTLAVTGATTLTAVLNTASSTAYSIKISSKTAAIPAGTPTAAGLIAFDSTYVMYVSTGTGPGAWVKIGGQ
jgi:hypothetical protein